MSANSKVLVKIAAGSGYDLTQKFTDEKGNPNKVLVPLDLGRSKPLAKHEVTAKMPPEYKGEKTEKLLNKYPYSGFDAYSKEGVITPVPVDKRDMNFAHLAQSYGGKMDVGLLDTNKAIAAQLGGGPLAESVANASAEYVRRNRYNALSRHDKRRYDYLSKKLGYKPHAITMTVPNNFRNTIVKTKPIPEDDEYGWWGRARILHDDKTGTPLFYNTRNGAVTFPEGSSALLPGLGRKMFQTDDPDEDDKINERFVPNDNFFVKNYFSGKFPITRENIPDEVDSSDIRIPFSSEGLISAGNSGYNEFISPGSGGRTIGDTDTVLIPGISISNKGLLFNQDLLNAADYFSNGSKSDSKLYALPADDKSIVDHEAIHTFNSTYPNDQLASEMLELDDAIEDLNSKAWYNPIGRAKAKSRVNDLMSRITASTYPSDMRPSEENGFIPVVDNYPSEGGTDELLRAIATTHRNYQKHLMNVIPEQMEARGELRGLTDKQKLDAMGRKIAELSYDGDNYLNFLDESGVGDGIPNNWKVLDNTVGGMSRREVNRGFTGLDEIMTPREELIKRLSPEVLKDYFKKAPNSYREIQREYIRKVIQYILRNDNKDVNPDGSVLA